jgi:pimeloyl-ACP methyl ester carboxylesterase
MTESCRFLPAMLAGMLLLAQAQGQDKTPPKLGNLEQTARAFIDLLAKGDFAKATADFDATMTKVMPPDELKKTWAKLVGDGGDFKKQLGSRTVTSGTYQIVFVTCEFARAKFDARVVFDKDARIAGLFFGPAKKKPAPTGAEEIYEGTLKVGAIEIALAFHLFKQKDGSYAGTMDSPAENVKGLVLDDVTVKDDTVRLELKSSKMVFEGKRSKDGKELDGRFKQSGQSFPLLLKRVAKATESRRPQLPTKPYPYEAIEVVYDNKACGVKLAGTLTVPKGPGPFPAALLITGSGPQDRDESILGHKPFLVLADYLTRHGIAVLRVDDRGVGGSTGKVDDATSADFAGDVQASVAFLKALKEINTAQIGLIGHSEGGIIAPLVASQSKDIAFIVLLAGTGLPGEDILYLQGAAILKVAGADAAQLARQKALQQAMFSVVRAEKDNVAAEKKIHAALKDHTEKLDAAEKKKMVEAMPSLEGQIKMVLTPWFRHFLTYDPRPALRKVSCPVLALNGGKDVQVDAAINLKSIEAALKEGGNKDVTVREFANLNHLFQTCKTGAVSEYGSIEETLAPVVLEAVARWILERTTGK